MPASSAADSPLLGALAQARALGFLGPGAVEAHVEHAESFLRQLPLLGEGGRGLDLGSGGGIPGLVLAWHLPSWRWVLVDSARRRTSFLVAAAATLGLAGRVQVIRARAEALGHDPMHRLSYDTVTARSFAPPPVTAEVGGAFVCHGGVLLVADPPDQPGRWDRQMLAQLGLEDLGASATPAIRTLARVGALDDRYPRSTAFRRPLG